MQPIAKHKGIHPSDSEAEVRFGSVDGHVTPLIRTSWSRQATNSRFYFRSSPTTESFSIYIIFSPKQDLIKQ